MYRLVKELGLVAAPETKRAKKDWEHLSMADKECLSGLLFLPGVAVAVAASEPQLEDAARTLTALLRQVARASPSHLVCQAAQAALDNVGWLQRLETTRQLMLTHAERAQMILEGVRATDRRQFQATILTIMGRLGHSRPDDRLGRDGDLTAEEFLLALGFDFAYFVKHSQGAGAE